ncbi:hypothetical protein K439DRAFT_1641916 [Ramaria rubella]|nr:hypothetical protein K439DRAFT_1641916 [Ramaria rubella]
MVLVENAGLVAGVAATKYTTVVALAFLLYDSASQQHFLLQVKYVWTQKWSFGKILYLYLYAVYNRNKKLLFTLLAIFVVGLTAVLVVVGLATARTPSFTATPEEINVENVMGPIQDFTGCYGIINQLDFITWVPPLVFEAILCFLMLFKAWTLYRRDWKDPLLSVIIRDSVLYFLTMFAVLLGNCLFWALSGVVPSSLPDVAVNWSVAVPCALGSRLLLNIRERYLLNEVITGASVRSGQDIGTFHAASKRHVSSVGNVSQSSTTT